MTALIKYEAACRALAECKAIDEVKAWADKAAAMQAYGRMAKDKTLEVDAAEIRIRAERRLGEIIAAQKAGPGLAKGSAGQLAGKTQDGQAVVVDDRLKTAPTLAQAGISKDLSSRAQKLAAVPAATFEAELAAKRERVTVDGERVSARLQAVGERELKKQKKQETAPTPESIEHEEGQLTMAELANMADDLQKENQLLQSHIKAMEADDQKAETLKWRKSYDHAQRQQSEAMDRAHKEQKLHAFKHRQLMRCGRAVGEDDPDKIAAAVEAFVRARGGVPQKVAA